jgi:acetylornithine deacetylase/succinyl-diaminopimelate desuccinylase-like protein
VNANEEKARIEAENRKKKPNRPAPVTPQVQANEEQARMRQAQQGPGLMGRIAGAVAPALARGAGQVAAAASDPAGTVGRITGAAVSSPLARPLLATQRPAAPARPPQPAQQPTTTPSAPARAPASTPAPTTDPAELRDRDLIARAAEDRAKAAPSGPPDLRAELARLDAEDSTLARTITRDPTLTPQEREGLVSRRQFVNQRREQVKAAIQAEMRQQAPERFATMEAEEARRQQGLASEMMALDAEIARLRAASATPTPDQALRLTTEAGRAALPANLTAGPQGAEFARRFAEREGPMDAMLARRAGAMDANAAEIARLTRMRDDLERQRANPMTPEQFAERQRAREESAQRAQMSEDARRADLDRRLMEDAARRQQATRFQTAAAEADVAEQEERARLAREGPRPTPEEMVARAQAEQTVGQIEREAALSEPSAANMAGQRIAGTIGPMIGRIRQGIIPDTAALDITLRDIEGLERQWPSLSESQRANIAEAILRDPAVQEFTVNPRPLDVFFNPVGIPNYLRIRGGLERIQDFIDRLRTGTFGGTLQQ